MDKKLGKKSVEMLKKKFFWELDSLVVKVFWVRKHYSNTGKMCNLSTVCDSTSS
jgi:hypothetical protein